METREAVMRLEEIADTIEELADEALGIVREVAPDEASYAKSYWHPHIVTAVRSEHDYVGGSMGPLEGTIETLRNLAAVRFPKGQAVVETDTGRTGTVVTPDEAARVGDGPEVEVEVRWLGADNREWVGVEELHLPD